MKDDKIGIKPCKSLYLKNGKRKQIQNEYLKNQQNRKRLQHRTVFFVIYSQDTRLNLNSSHSYMRITN